MVHKVGSKKNWYGVLQVKDYSAKVVDINKIYKRMVLMLHPDKCRYVAMEGTTKIVNAAWDLLSDLRRRASHDKLIGCNQPPEKRTNPNCASSSSSSGFGGFASRSSGCNPNFGSMSSFGFGWNPKTRSSFGFG
ncbi:hypothetical protein LWI28_015171 [Acer negundo]|uniref:J domain-containing protein n=1 Tax=Acer negundo TaxID=4023 RepID=A0AAD5NZP1_ACENE|nr:hypothetical protein LWI28_015171 [Acer negundo]